MPAAPKVEAVKQESLDHQARVASGSLAEPTGRLHAYHDAAYEVVWTTEERAALDTGMTRCSMSHSTVQCCRAQVQTR